MTGRESYDKDVLIPAGIELVSCTDLESNPGKETAKTKTRVYPNSVLIPHEIELIPRKDLESVREGKIRAIKNKIFPSDILTPTKIEMVPSRRPESNQVKEDQLRTSETTMEGKKNIRIKP